METSQGETGLRYCVRMKLQQLTFFSITFHPWRLPAGQNGPAKYLQNNGVRSWIAGLLGRSLQGSHLHCRYAERLTSM